MTERRQPATTRTSRQGCLEPQLQHHSQRVIHTEPRAGKNWSDALDFEQR